MVRQSAANAKKNTTSIKMVTVFKVQIAFR
jgi:hypothetical protein